MARKNETNDEFISRLMNFGPTGALQQLFILEAVRKYADACAAAPASTFDSPMMNGEAWVKTAKYIKAEMEAHYAPRRAA